MALKLILFPLNCTTYHSTRLCEMVAMGLFIHDPGHGRVLDLELEELARLESHVILFSWVTWNTSLKLSKPHFYYLQIGGRYCLSTGLLWNQRSILMCSHVLSPHALLLEWWWPCLARVILGLVGGFSGLGAGMLQVHSWLLASSVPRVNPGTQHWDTRQTMEPTTYVSVMMKWIIYHVLLDSRTHILPS